MASIVSTLWDFGNGEISNEQKPIEQFEPGEYTVTLTLTDSDDVVYVVEKTLYIAVGETDSTLASGNYLDNPKCLHFGWKDEHGFGWSENKGNFPWPLTPASVIEYEEDGIVYTLVYDITDGKEYHINTYNNHVSEASYRDKDIYPIETEVITPEFTGEMKSYQLSHVETNVKYKPDIMEDEFLPDFEVNVSLLTDSSTRSEPVETQYKVNTSKEVMFYYQNRQTEETRQRQLRLTTSESNFQLLNYESYFRSNDKLKRKPVNDSMLLFGNPAQWYTRTQGYLFDMISAESTTNSIDSTVEGVDGIADTGANVTDYALFNDVSRQSLIFWSLTVPAFSNGLTMVAYGVPVNGWQLYFYNGTIATGTTLTGSIFDLRLFDEVLPEEMVFEYHDKYTYYLPRI